MFYIDSSNHFNHLQWDDIVNNPLNYVSGNGKVVVYIEEDNLHKSLLKLGFLKGSNIDYISLISLKLESCLKDIWFSLNGTEWFISKKPTSLEEAKEILNDHFKNKRIKENLITVKQIEYLNALLKQKKNKYLKDVLQNDFNFQLEALTKGAAGLLINHALKLTAADLNTTLEKYKEALLNE